jgi:predicted nuclease of predicted toxin-antitoxin system
VNVKLDENLPTELADWLRSEGHDVHTVPEENFIGEEDAVIAARAQ